MDRRKFLKGTALGLIAVSSPISISAAGMATKKNFARRTAQFVVQAIRTDVASRFQFGEKQPYYHS